MELSNDEVRFLNENIVLKDYFYDLLLNIKNSNKTKIIICKNSYERRFVHILANSLGLCHSRYMVIGVIFLKNIETIKKI